MSLCHHCMFFFTFKHCTNQTNHWHAGLITFTLHSIMRPNMNISHVDLLCTASLILVSLCWITIFSIAKENLISAFIWAKHSSNYARSLNINMYLLLENCSVKYCLNQVIMSKLLFSAVGYSLVQYPQVLFIQPSHQPLCILSMVGHSC